MFHQLANAPLHFARWILNPILTAKSYETTLCFTVSLAAHKCGIWHEKASVEHRCCLTMRMAMRL